jgi:hypothetical protein
MLLSDEVRAKAAYFGGLCSLEKSPLCCVLKSAARLCSVGAGGFFSLLKTGPFDPMRLHSLVKNSIESAL